MGGGLVQSPSPQRPHLQVSPGVLRHAWERQNLWVLWAPQP